MTASRSGPAGSGDDRVSRARRSGRVDLDPAGRRDVRRPRGRAVRMADVASGRRRCSRVTSIRRGRPVRRPTVPSSTIPSRPGPAVGDPRAEQRVEEPDQAIAGRGTRADHAAERRAGRAPRRPSRTAVAHGVGSSPGANPARPVAAAPPNARGSRAAAAACGSVAGEGRRVGDPTQLPERDVGLERREATGRWRARPGRAPAPGSMRRSGPPRSAARASRRRRPPGPARRRRSRGHPAPGR